MTAITDNMTFGIFLAPFHRVGGNPTLALEAAGVTADLPVVVLSICLAGVPAVVVAGLVIGPGVCWRTCWLPATSRSSTSRDR